MPWKLIDNSRPTQKYYRGTFLYGSGSDLIDPNIGIILMYSHLSMLLICGFLMVLALCLYVINIYAMLQRLCYVRLRVVVI